MSEEITYTNQPEIVEDKTVTEIDGIVQDARHALGKAEGRKA